MKTRLIVEAALAAAAAFTVAACSDSGTNNTPDTGIVDATSASDSGTTPAPDVGSRDTGTTLADTGVGGADGGDAGTGGGMDATTPDSGRTGMLRTLTPPPMDPGPGAVLFTVSGETPAVAGWAFPPQSMNDTFIVDGWEFRLDRYIGVFDKVSLWSDPNIMPTQQNQHGALVAELDGPWAVDMHKGGPFVGKGGGGEQAVAFGALTKKMDNTAFDTTVTYGFGFSTVGATWNAFNVNLVDADLDDYQYMVDNGYSVLYVGTVTFRGANCTQTATPAYSQAMYAAWPQTFKFRMGFSTPTNYVNCQNGTDLAGPGVNGEDHPRGIQFKANGSIIAQVTIHMDHPFWESFAENSPLHWDQIAAHYIGVQNPLARTEDFKGVDFTNFTDVMMHPLPWRSCVSASFYTPPGTGQMFFNHLSVPYNPNPASDPHMFIRDYYDYLRYTQSTQGHLNSQGLCYIDRQFAAPPGGS